jgi:dynein heavy chain
MDDFKKLKDQLTDMCLFDLNPLERTKVETLVTIHVHQVDVFKEIGDLCRQNKIKDNNDFEWQKNTRCKLRADDNDIQVSVTDVDFTYSYEYLGAKERLCITALTDRCYVTLAQALGMYYGGAPAGPAGTGKTETVKDLGRTLGIFVVVTNCSDEHRYRDMAKIFKGICQSGLWGCFDEFNRISLPTLSVVASQVGAITNAKKNNLKKFDFPGEERPIILIKSCGYFITMNPGYAGRQELPENLKVLFRGVTMMRPDRRIIMMVKLSSVGYKDSENLSFKFNELYHLCEEQLSAQRHYDFGLRNILSVLRTAGNSKRQLIGEQYEEMILSRTLRDMNLSKFVAQDIPLFKSLLKDIFPKNADPKKKEYALMEKAVNKIMKERNLSEAPDWFIKIVQLYETSLVRHGFMVVGSAGSGKTTIMNCLTDALSETEMGHKMTRLNPKSLTGGEMYGVMNVLTNEWIPGVFSEIWKKCNDKKNKTVNWIVCDGPVDAIWIENLNTVLDDNRILTLANAERIPMIDYTKMTFEVENLNNASPATVSRCGIIYVSFSDLGWKPLINTWLLDRKSDKTYCCQDEEKWMNDLIAKYIWKVDTEKNIVTIDMFKTIKKDYHYVMELPEVIRVTQLLNLFTTCLEEFRESMDIDKLTFEKFFVYCLAWSCAGLMEQDDREKFHKYLDSRNAPLPNISSKQVSMDKETIFDYFFDKSSKQWKIWEPESWTAPKRIIFSQLLIPTADSCRAEYIINKIATLNPVRSNIRKEPGAMNTLLVGSSGTAKTSVVQMYINKFDNQYMLQKRINFSSATLPKDFQTSMEAEVEKKQSRVFAPPQGKKMTVFLDDMSMPLVNTWGDQITLEITRQLIEHKGFYFLEKDLRGYFRQIDNLQFLGAMMHPGNGRNDIPHRLKRHFFSINMTPPSTRSIENIYGRILEALFNPKKYSQEVIGMKSYLVDATISIWDSVKKRLLPTPQKFHYVFTIRELARVFSGICTVASKPEYKVIKDCLNIKQKMRPELFMIALWRHECDRTFIDKLTNNADKKIFTDLLDRTTKEKFRDSLGLDDEQLMTDYLFADFMRNDVFDEYGDLVEKAPFVYEASPDIEYIRNVVNNKLESYNGENPQKAMNLVMFDDALRHLLRITRVINTKGGHILLVGVGGSGKQSLSKLASYITNKDWFQISLTKTYGDSQLRENVRDLYQKAGPGGKSVSFMLTDAEIKFESFLEAINSMLATGEIPGLIPKEDRDIFALESKGMFIKEVAGGQKSADPTTLELWNFFINRVKDELHMILAFSPVGTKFR